jgi:hypothetical protein
MITGWLRSRRQAEECISATGALQLCASRHWLLRITSTDDRQ